ncbi:metal dependent phosphohydrolase [Gracilibacillus halophilus YIM-C55.5]|uniref:Metal dependent phosphohydrolase n=1 Tax=Gracilibacillus halophilus YIM-C55.5 TaxID=1308866 RepID=N4WDX3_9BACI|nr:HD-GYP domain-containing protein [Gracilibacillus halophilus]ENH98458.1 metal dependent phosphohydrolase [Gracilibacillus halophilus YIM-C55.5]
MQVHPKQLVSGCVLKDAVYGKTNHPIIPRQTVIDQKHMQVLLHFGIESVVVSDMLDNGERFEPQKITETQDEDEAKYTMTLPFETLYIQAVKQYKQIFTKWQSGSPVVMHEVREMIMPLFEKIDDVHLDLFLLHRFSNKEDYFYHHGISVALISAHIAQKLGYEKEWIQIGLAGLLSDCGMAKIQMTPFHKTTQLTIEEYEEIKKHPTYSYKMIENISSLSKDVKIAILEHHERLDGSGYPLGVRDDKIHLFAKIIAVSDTYHAMTSERLYRPKQSPFKVMEELLRLQHYKFDHQVLQVFVQSLMNYTIGTQVQLSNGKKGYLVFIDEHDPTRPMVRLMENDEIISLKDKPTVFIEDIDTH